MTLSRRIAGISNVVAIFALVFSITMAPLFAPRAEAGVNSVIKGFVGGTAYGLASCAGTYGTAKLVQLISSATDVPGTNDDGMWQAIKTNCLDPVSQQIAQQILKSMTQKTLDWVTTGMNGNPFYVRDLESYLGSVSDQSLRSFIDDFAQKENPYAKDIAKSLATTYLKDKYDYVPDFTLDKIVGSDWQDFSDGDFRKGGWDGWLAMTQLPQNNPVGAALLASSTVNKKISKDVAINQEDLSQNNGFLSMKRCVSKKENTGSGGQGDDPGLSYLFSGNGNSDNCNRYETVTPGTAIADQLNISVNQGKQNLLDAKDLSATLNSVFSVLFDQILTQGITSLTSSNSGGNTSEFSGYGSNTLEESLVFDNNNSWTNLPTTDQVDITKIDDYLSLQNDMIATITAYSDKINTYIPLVHQADFCLPGPNPVWYEAAQERANQEGEALPESGGTFNASYVNKVIQWTGVYMNFGNANIDSKQEMIEILRRLVSGSNYKANGTNTGNSFMPGYKTYVDARFNSSTLLPIGPSIIKEYKGLSDYVLILKNNEDKIVDYKSIINALNYIKNQYNSLPPKTDPSYQEKYDALQISANSIIVGMAKASDIQNQSDLVTEMKGRIDLMNDPDTGLIAECEKEFAAFPNLPKNRRPYPANLLPAGFAGYPTDPSFFPTDGTYSVGDSTGKPNSIHITDFVNLDLPPAGYPNYPDGSSMSFANVETMLGIY